ncbi:MAG: hypothetical protein V1850_00235 [Candidatus Bathyarchaeota archaeon]
MYDVGSVGKYEAPDNSVVANFSLLNVLSKPRAPCLKRTED